MHKRDVVPLMHCVLCKTLVVFFFLQLKLPEHSDWHLGATLSTMIRTGISKGNLKSREKGVCVKRK